MAVDRTRHGTARPTRLHLGGRGSWKEQTLRNIVRLRYGDAPSFVDVSSVISAYPFQGQVTGVTPQPSVQTIPASWNRIWQGERV